MPKLRGCLQGAGGGPKIGEVTCGWSPHLTCKRDQIKMRDFGQRITSPTWGPPPPCKQALNECQSTSEPKQNLFPGFFLRGIYG